MLDPTLLGVGDDHHVPEVGRKAQQLEHRLLDSVEQLLNVGRQAAQLTHVQQSVLRDERAVVVIVVVADGIPGLKTRDA